MGCYLCGCGVIAGEIQAGPRVFHLCEPCIPHALAICGPVTHKQGLWATVPDGLRNQQPSARRRMAGR